MKNYITTKLHSFKWFALKYGTAAVIGAMIMAYSYEPLQTAYDRIQGAFAPTEYVAASTTPETIIVDDFERQVQAEKETKDAQEMVDAWAKERVAQRIRLQMAEIEAAAAKKVSSFE